VKSPEHRLEDLTFHYQLSHGMDVEIVVFSIEGQEIASFLRRYNGVIEELGTAPGPNRVRWEEIEGRPSSLAPGLYVFSIEAWDGASEARAFGKFAVIR